MGQRSSKPVVKKYAVGSAKKRKVSKTPQVVLYLDCDLGQADADHHEERHYAELAEALKGKLESAGCKVLTYSLLNDLIFKKKKKMPKSDACVVLHWEWPHDLKNVFDVYDRHLRGAARLMPLHSELCFFRSKGKVFQTLLAEADDCKKMQIPISPSIVFDALAYSVAEMEMLQNKIFEEWQGGPLLAKQTYSPKGQVTKRYFFKSKDDVRRALNETCTEVHSAIFNDTAQEYFEDHGCTLLQKWEPRYSTELEIVLYFSCGVFLYALGSYGWTVHLNAGRGKRVPNELLQDHFQICVRVFELFPSLCTHALISVSFGPRCADGPVFRTATIFPPLRGGPTTTGKGSAWKDIINFVSDNMLHQTLALLRDEKWTRTFSDAKHAVPTAVQANNEKCPFPSLRYLLREPMPDRPVLMIVIDSHYYGDESLAKQTINERKKLETEFFTLPIERLSYREIARGIEEYFTERGVDVCYYSIDEDIIAGTPWPAHDVSCFVFSDWHTFHDDPECLDDLLAILNDRECPCVPSNEQLTFIWKKTQYLWALMQLQNDHAGEVKSSESHSKSSSINDAEHVTMRYNTVTCCVDDCESPVHRLLLPTMLLSEKSLSEQLECLKRLHPECKFLVKENYSACKLGVSGSLGHDELEHYTRRTFKEYEEMRYAEHVSYMDQECICQQYSEDFLTSTEVRLFFSRTEFLYAVGFFGWIPHGALPHGIEDDSIVQPRLATVRYIFDHIPQLTQFPIIRFDFGPNGVLNEIEVQCDLFGGPHNDLSGPLWMHAKDSWVKSYCEDITKAFGSKLQ